MTEIRGTLRPLTLDDIHLHVEIPAGSLVEEDCTCDSDFMLDIIHEVGTNIRKSFNWVPSETIIHLFMDNAGGHGTNKARNEYVKILYDDYKVEVIWQIANLCHITQNQMSSMEGFCVYIPLLYWSVRYIYMYDNSPETNMLDLGAWVTVQCIVAHMHHGKRIQKDALCKTVYHAFFLSIVPNSKTSHNVGSVCWI
jgi:hypothetical protein